METAEAVKLAGAQVLRGGAYKPRTSPYDFQGLEVEGLKLLAEARAQTGLKNRNRSRDHRRHEVVAEYADILQLAHATCRTSRS